MGTYLFFHNPANNKNEELETKRRLVYIPYSLDVKPLYYPYALSFQLVPQQILTLATLKGLLLKYLDVRNDPIAIWAIIRKFNTELQNYGFKEQIILEFDTLEPKCNISIKNN